jgi:lipid II:glycine glycyltransferase (peptidoglycan interpeptide bridge formation enzyme)
MLRIASHDRRDASPGTDAWCAEYEAAGLTRPKQTPRQTILLELSHSLDALRKGLNQKWRNQLNQAEKKGLEFVAGTDDGLYGCFEDLYRDMHARKGFEEHVDVGEFRRVQRDIPDALKMRIAIARLDGQAVAGGVWSAIGDTGIYLLGATNALGMKNQGAYLLQWRAIEWMKQSGCRWYDLGGIDAVANPGVYHFKSGIAGKLGREISESACFEACANPLSRLAIRSSERLKEEYRAWRRRVSAAKQTPDARAEDDSAKVPLPAAATSQS